MFCVCIECINVFGLIWMYPYVRNWNSGICNEKKGTRIIINDKWLNRIDFTTKNIETIHENPICDVRVVWFINNIWLCLYCDVFIQMALQIRHTRTRTHSFTEWNVLTELIWVCSCVTFILIASNSIFLWNANSMVQWIKWTLSFFCFLKW